MWPAPPFPQTLSRCLCHPNLAEGQDLKDNIRWTVTRVIRESYQECFLSMLSFRPSLVILIEPQYLLEQHRLSSYLWQMHSLMTLFWDCIFCFPREFWSTLGFWGIFDQQSCLAKPIIISIIMFHVCSSGHNDVSTLDFLDLILKLASSACGIHSLSSVPFNCLNRTERID